MRRRYLGRSVLASTVAAGVLALGALPVAAEAEPDPAVAPEFTPTLRLDADQGELVVRTLDGAAVATSGPMTAGDWTVPEGVLESGVSYVYDAVDTFGDAEIDWQVPTLRFKATGKNTIETDHDPLSIGAAAFDVDVVQAAQGFDVDLGIGFNGAGNGLEARFWPMVCPAGTDCAGGNDDPDGGESPLFPPEIGTQTVSFDMEVVDQLQGEKDAFKNCEYKLIGSKPISWILCNLKVEIAASVSGAAWDESVAAAADAADYNTHGRNVYTPHGLTITDDNVSEPGAFVLSTAGRDVISATFPAQTGFAYRMLGYITVPEGGTYTFGTTSPGGARAYIYDTRDDDLGETEISDPGAWQPTFNECSATTGRYEFKNDFSHTEGDFDGATHRTYRIHQYGPDDTSWFQLPEEAFISLFDQLRTNCTDDGAISWGAPTELEAGRQYPIDLTGWVGPIGGEIGLYVTGPDGEQMPVPIEWLSPASRSTIDFERTQLPATTLDDELAGWAINGVGDELVGIDTDGDLVAYTKNGYQGWEAAGVISDVVAGIPDPGHYGIGEAPPGVRPYDSTLFQLTTDTTTAEWELPLPVKTPEKYRVETPATIKVDAGLDGLVSGALDGPTTLTMTDRVTRMQLLPNQPFYQWELAQMHLDELTFTGSPTELEIVTLAGRYDYATWGGFTAEANAVIDPASATIQYDPASDTITVEFALTGSSNPTRNVDGATMRIEVPVTGISPTGGYEPTDGGMSALIAVSAKGETVVVGTDRIAGDVAIITKDDKRKPFDDGNIASITLLSELVEPPAVAPAMSGSVSQSGTRVGTKMHGSQPATSVTGAVDIVDGHGSIDGESIVAAVELHMPGWIENYQLTLDRLDFDVDPEGTLANVDVDGELYIDAGQPTSYELGAVTGSIDLAGGKLILTVPAVGEPKDSTLVLDLHHGPPRSVQISPDGNTIAVVQPTGTGGRVDVVDRRSTSGEWTLLGSFDIDGPVPGHITVPVAVGRNGSTRYLAVANGTTVDIHTSTGASSEWNLVDTIQTTAPPTAIDFDERVKFLAIGQAGPGRVDIYQHTEPTWSHLRTLEPDGDTNFGADVSFGWNLLAITDDGDYRCEENSVLVDTCTADGSAYTTPGYTFVYRNIDSTGAWGDFSGWTRLDHGEGGGTHVATSLGGDLNGWTVVGAARDIDGFGGPRALFSRPGHFAGAG